MKKNIYIYNELNDVIDAMKTTITINSISELEGVSTINTSSIKLFDNLEQTIDLTDGMIVTINSINYVVSNVTHTPIANTFDIAATNLVATEWNVAANFKTGSRTEINQILQQDSGNLNRFPLIWLLPPEQEDYDHPVHDFTAEISLVFAHKSNKTDRTTSRITNNFEPVLQPLMNLFLAWMLSSDFNYVFEFFGKEKPINYTKTNYPFYGTSDKTKEVLNTTTDAIESTMQLTFKKQFEY